MARRVGGRRGIERPEAVELIEQLRPDLALLDLQMPELGGLDAVRLVSAGALPAIAFVTAFDEFAVQAFELNAVDYLLKPVERERLKATLDRARIRVGAGAAERARTVTAAASAYDAATRRTFLERIPVRRRDEVVIVPVRQIASIVAEGELLHITTVSGERYSLSHRLHALEARLDPRRFVRLGRGRWPRSTSSSASAPCPAAPTRSRSRTARNCR